MLIFLYLVILMGNISIEICKKEFLARFGSKASFIPLIITFAIPIIVFIPQMFIMFKSPEKESKLVAWMFFLILPVMVTNIIGISAFINEIRWKTIKTLLIAPIDMSQLFIGKSLASIMTGIIADFFISLFLIGNGISLNFTNALLFFILSPLTIIFSTFILIIGTSKYPKVAENGGGIYFSIIALIIVFSLLLILQTVLNTAQEVIDILFILIIGLLSLITYFYAKKLFNTETLATSW